MTRFIPSPEDQRALSRVRLRKAETEAALKRAQDANIEAIRAETHAMNVCMRRMLADDRRPRTYENERDVRWKIGEWLRSIPANKLEKLAGWKETPLSTATRITDDQS